MLSIVDADMSGEIAFSEFVIAALVPKEVISNDNLKQLFALFDSDRSNNISMRELKDAICAGRNLDNGLWLAAINNINGDNNNASSKNIN